MVAFRSVQREEMEGQRRLARFAKCLTEPSPDLRRLWENASAKAYSLHWSSPNDHSGLAGVLYTGFIVRLWSQFVVSPSSVSKVSKDNGKDYIQIQKGSSPRSASSRNRMSSGSSGSSTRS